MQRWRNSGQCGGAWAPGAASASAGAARLTVGATTAAQAAAVGAFTCGTVVPAAGASPGAQQQGAMVRGRSCWHRFSCWQQRAADGVRGARLAPTLEAARRTAARAEITRGAGGLSIQAIVPGRIRAVKLRARSVRGSATPNSVSSDFAPLSGAKMRLTPLEALAVLARLVELARG